MSSQPPVTDSPWYWVGLFALAALVGMIAIGPKFYRRQEVLQQKSQAREQVWRDRVEGATPPDASPVDDATDQAWAARLRLWPLMAAALVVTCVAWGKLWSQRRAVESK